ncbi:MAG: hypothetical protein RL612_200, partial [Actinomycetota bacterium]
MIKPLIDRIRAFAPNKIAYGIIAAFVATVLMILVPSTNANAGTYSFGATTTVTANAGGGGGSDQGQKNCPTTNNFMKQVDLAWNNTSYITLFEFQCTTGGSTTSADFTGTSAVVTYFNASSGGNAWKSCSTGSAINGFEVSTNGFIYDIGIICRNYLTGSESTSGLNRGSVTATYRCSNGSYVTGMSARTGAGM